MKVPVATNYAVDRTGWPAGPWDKEEDLGFWVYKGYNCLIVRNDSGSLCGYVGVLEGHPAYEKQFREVAVSIHGGLTFSDKAPDGTWWLGFDCGHISDLSPRVSKALKEIPELRALPTILKHGIYRDWQYVKEEVEDLAGQLLAMAKFPNSDSE